MKETEARTHQELTEKYKGQRRQLADGRIIKVDGVSPYGSEGEPVYKILYSAEPELLGTGQNTISIESFESLAEVPNGSN